MDQDIQVLTSSDHDDRTFIACAPGINTACLVMQTRRRCPEPSDGTAQALNAAGFLRHLKIIP